MYNTIFARTPRKNIVNVLFEKSRMNFSNHKIWYLWETDNFIANDLFPVHFRKKTKNVKFKAMIYEF